MVNKRFTPKLQMKGFIVFAYNYFVLNYFAMNHFRHFQL